MDIQGKWIKLKIVTMERGVFLRKEKLKQERNDVEKLCFLKPWIYESAKFFKLSSYVLLPEAFQAYEEDSHINSSAIVSTSLISLFIIVYQKCIIKFHVLALKFYDAEHNL